MPQMTIPEIFRSITHTVTRVFGMVPASDYDEVVDELCDFKLASAIDQSTLQASFRRIRQTHALERFADFVGLEDVVITDEIEPGMMSVGVNFDMPTATAAFEKMGLRFEEIIIEEDITEKVTSDEPVKGAERLGDFVTQKFADPATPENQLKSTEAIGVLDKAIDDFPADNGVAPEPIEHDFVEPYPHPGKAAMKGTYVETEEYGNVSGGYRPPTEFNVGGKKFKGER